MRRPPRRAALAVILILAALTVSLTAQRLPPSVSPRHYALWFAPDFATDTFRGTAHIEVTTTRRTTSLTLHAAELTFDAASVTARGRTQTARVSFDVKAETATLTFPEAIPSGQAVIDIRFTGILNNQLRGFYLSTANGRKYAVTQLEATDARRMFPGFDEPAFKATFDVSVTAPTNNMAISNGAIVSDLAGPDPGTHTVTFARTPKMSSYLVALLVGNFACRSGASGDIPIRVCATPDKLPLTAFALESTEAQLRLLTEYFGVRYPFGKLDIIGIPDFSAGAMENAGAITFRESVLLADGDRASINTRKTIASTIAHELAHQWFGDLVTMQWWNDIWLNEGFATWAESKPISQWKPDWKIEVDDAVNTGGALATDSQQSTRAIRMKVDTPDEINEVFDGITYEKTAAVLRMVEHYTGKEPFRKGVSSYLNRFAFRNAAGEDFWREMTRVTGKPVDQILSSFVTQVGAPLVSVTSACQGGRTRLSLRQSRFVGAPGAPAPLPQAWTMPVCARPATGGASVCRVMSAATDTITLPGCGTPVLVNPDATGYFLTEYTPAHVRDLAGRHLPSLAEVDRLRLAGDAWWMARAGKYDIGTYLDVAGAMAGDTSEAVVDEIAGRLGYILNDIATPSDRARLSAWIRARFSQSLAAIGVTPKPGDSDELHSRRATLIGLVGITGGDAAVAAEVKTLAARYFDDRSALPGTLVRTVLNLNAQTGDAVLYDTYLSRMRSVSSEPEEYYRYLGALSAFPGQSLMERTLALTLSGEIRSQDVTRPVFGAMGRSDLRPAAWRFITTNWDALTARLDTFQGLPGVVAAVGLFCSAAEAAEVRRFFESHPVPPAARALQRALERVETCVAVQQRQQAALTTWLDQRTAGL
ncbi:MAG: M1 family metallopeptidase [Vicinamibacterales bacterium]